MSPEKKKKDAEMRKKLRKDVVSYEDKNLPEDERVSPMDESEDVDLDKWQPGLDDIPITAQLTRANKEKLAKRDEEIEIQAEKLREIEEMIAKRKAERNAKAEEFERMNAPAKTSKKKGKKNKLADANEP